MNKLPRKMPTTINGKDWETKWAKNKALTDSYIPDPGFRVYSQCFSGTVLHNGVRYHVTAWAPPGKDKPYVDCYKLCSGQNKGSITEPV